MATPFVNLHTHRPAGAALTLRSLGIHPWWLDDPGYDWELALQTLEQQLKEGSLDAVGEAGLDKLHPETLPLQRTVFERQIRLAEQYGKPLVIHCVRAYDEVMQLWKRHQPRQAWILHGFNGNRETAGQLTEKGIYLSVGTAILFQNRKITESIPSIPLDRLFLETDEADDPIETVYAEAARLLSLPLEVLKEQIFTNFVRLKQA
ncbi:MAG: TatD family hydrolase [Bacteroidales bacterium]|nr:TatD family hydrolase [Bacteroidales bacterium]